MSDPTNSPSGGPVPKPLHPALIAKAEAETERIKAETRRAKAEAKAAEASARLMQLKRLHAEQDVREEEVSDEALHVYRFGDQVSASTARACIARLNLWSRLDPGCDIEIIFNSPGGSVIDGMALYDQIVALSKRGGGDHTITIGSRGYAASMAGILLQAGDVRWLGANSYLMIHEISAGADGKIGEMTDRVDFYKRICEQVVDLFVDRADGKITREKFVKNWERKDWWLLANEARQLGFVDEVR